MRLTVFQSGKGDCLLLANAAGTSRMLIDGGMPDAYRDHVAPALGRLRARKQRIDLVYVSHIDQDHIGGVLQMLNDEVDWRVHEFQQTHGNPTHRAPSVPRPPEIGGIWHNAFSAQLTRSAEAIENTMAAAAPVLSGADIEAMRQAGLQQAGLVTSIREAIQVSRRIAPNQLGIPLNAQAGGKLMMQRKGQQPVALGGMALTILGPSEPFLRKLRADWELWLDGNAKALKAISGASRQIEGRLGTSDFDRFLFAFKLQAESFGQPQSVTPPNLASLTLLVEEAGQSIVLTGDARGDRIVDGLEATGRLNGGTFTADVLKVPHHGSKNNVDSDFCEAVIARDYVFCGNGEHANPHLEVIEMMGRRRLAASGRCKFWFNSSSAVSERVEAAAHMKEVEQVVRQLVKSSKGRLTSTFLNKGSSLRVL